jgi:hypothetical protein
MKKAKKAPVPAKSNLTKRAAAAMLKMPMDSILGKSSPKNPKKPGLFTKGK